MKERVGSAAETYKENQAKADIHVKQKVSYLLYCYNPRNGRITFYFFFFLVMMNMHIKSDREIVCMFLLS